MDNTTSRYSFDITEILKDIKDTLKEATHLDVFIGSRPNASSKQRDEMLVVSLPYSIRNKGVIQTTYLKIEIIVKDKSEGVSNVVQLENLTNKVQCLFPLGGGDCRYHALIPDFIYSGKDTLGYTIWQLQGKMIVNKTDTY